MLRDRMAKCTANDWQQHVLGLDGIWGVALVIRGEIAAGIRWLEHSILRREREGYRVLADWFRLYLCEIYLEIISGKERPPAKVLAANMLMLAKVMFTAEKRIVALVEQIRQIPQFDPDGHFFGRSEMMLGLLTLAVQHLREAKHTMSQFGPTPMLAKIEGALAELG
jgi:hypothetical protein